MRTDKKLWRNRKATKELARRLQSENPGLEVVPAQAAGIDVGNSAHYVAVRPDRDPQPVRRFARNRPHCAKAWASIARAARLVAGLATRWKGLRPPGPHPASGTSATDILPVDFSDGTR
jgi:hypothetical protein